MARIATIGAGASTALAAVCAAVGACNCRQAADERPWPNPFALWPSLRGTL